MSTHTHIATDQERSEREAVAAPGAVVVACPRPCPVCGQAVTGRKTSSCSDKCRAAKSRRNRQNQLATLEAQLARIVTRVRALRGAHDQR